MTQDQLITTVSETIARKVGWYRSVRKGLPQPLSRRLNNPGLLTYWRRHNGREFEKCWSDDEGEFGYIEFADAETGWRVLKARCRSGILKHRASGRSLFSALVKRHLSTAADGMLNEMEWRKEFSDFMRSLCLGEFPADKPLMDAVDQLEIKPGRLECHIKIRSSTFTTTPN